MSGKGIRPHRNVRKKLDPELARRVFPPRKKSSRRLGLAGGVALMAALFTCSVAAGAFLGKLSLDRRESYASAASLGDIGEGFGSGGPLEPISDQFMPDPLHGTSASADYGAELEHLTYTISMNDNLYTALTAMGVPDALILSWCEVAKKVYNLSKVKPGQTLCLYYTPDKEYVKLELTTGSDERLVISRDGEAGYQAYKEYVEPDPGEGYDSLDIPVPLWIDPDCGYRHYRGVISSNFYESALRAGMTPNKIMSLIQVFGTINFSRDVAEGDRFSVVVAAGEDEDTEGPILAAMIEARGENRYIFRYEQGDNIGYYTEDGREAKTHRLLCPLRYTRISSYYTHRRYHPVLHVYRPHRGVDYAAPSGTPVKAAAGGRVVYVGWKGQYGRTVAIRHNSEFRTQYAHLSRYARGLKTGQWVRQGQVIGYVGATGLATGPHLDYRVYRNGKPVNPLRVTGMPPEPVKDLKGFANYKESMMAQLVKELPAGPPLPPHTAADVATTGSAF